MTNLDASLTALVERKNTLSKMSYDDKNYDNLEEELHDLEDDFIEEYGEMLEGALQEVHDKICPDSDVLLPIAYLAKKYVLKGKNPDGSPNFDVEGKEGVWVDAEKFPDRDTRLVLIPNPTRIMLIVDGKSKEIVWQAK